MNRKSQPKVKFIYTDPQTRKSVATTELGKVPFNTVAVQLFLSDDGKYYSTGEHYIYSDIEIIERNDEYCVEWINQDVTSDQPTQWYYFKSMEAATKFIDRM